MSTAREHTELVHAIRLALGREDDFTIWNNSVVTIKKGKPRAKPGLGTGSSDLIGILYPGIFVALEVKTGNARPTKEQQMFINLIRLRGGFARVVHSVEEAKQALEEARASRQ